MSAKDLFQGESEKVLGPVTSGFDVTPSDDDEFNHLTRGLIVGTQGDVAVQFQNGNTLVLPALLPGVVHPFRVAKVLSTGTSATQVKALF